MKLDKLNHKSIVGTSYNTLLFDKRLSFFVVVSILKDDICYNQGNRARYALNTMNKNVLFVFVCVLNEVNDPIKETLNILILRVFEEKGKISDFFRLKPILAIITCAVYNVFDLMFLKSVIIFCNFFAWDVKSLDNFAAFLLTFLSFTSSFLWSVCHSTA